MARKPFVVNDAIREKVRHLAGLGVPQDDIAKIVQCSPKTLRKRCREDLDRGAAANKQPETMALASAAPQSRSSRHRLRNVFGEHLTILAISS